MADDIMLRARALVLHDLSARDMDTAAAVDVLEHALVARRWWIEQWPEGAPFLAGLIAQDVQEHLLDNAVGRWPRCTACDEIKHHDLRIRPDLGPDPHWVCEESGIRVAALGAL
ncbi:MAG: hypothetical protein ACRDVZ_17860 [Jiangellaceae bacterium]